MKIAKYLFLLLILLATTVSVFIATKDGRYTVQKSRIINVPKEKVYNYVLDYKNWANFDFIKKDSALILNYSPITAGIKSQLSWQGSTTSGNIKSLFVIENDSISQEMSYNGEASQMNWKFKDTLNSTKVTWSANGEMNFKEKCYALIYGESKIKMGILFEKGLANISNILSTETNTFKINVEGFVERDTLVYLQSLAQCNIKDLPQRIKKIVPKLKLLASNTNTKSGGSPFIVYHSRDTIANTIKFSIAIPVTKKVYTSQESDILPGQIMPFQAVKATLEGDYSHKNDLLQQVYQYMKKNKLSQNYSFKVIEILRKSIATDESPAQWVTDIYVPVKLKKAIVKPVKRDTIPAVVNTIAKDTSR
jgi:predicted transcriptional regulator YdeE